MVAIESLVDAGGGTLKRFTVAEYHAMQCGGILNGEKAYELLDGLVVEKLTQETPHASARTRLDRWFIRSLPDRWVFRSQSPISLRRSEPEPDGAICTGPVERCDLCHPTPEEIQIVIEVADSTLKKDQSVKLPLYAQARIAEYWIVNLIDRRVEVYTQPRGGKKPTYRIRTDHAAGSSVPVVLEGNEVGSIAVDEILPRS